MEPDISVVVPSRERRESLRRLLRALQHQTLPPDRFEVITSLNGPDDGSEQMIADWAAPYALRSIRQAAHGRAAACNAGVRAATGRLIVILDDDMEPAPGCLAGHLAAHDGNTSRGIVGAAPIPLDEHTPPLVAYRARGFARKMVALEQLRGPLQFSQVYTGNFSIPRTMFIDVGGYDEEFTLYGHEDYELALRLARAGAEFLFSTAALSIQHYDKDLRGLAANILAEGQTAVQFARKHPEVFTSLELSRYHHGARSVRMTRSVLLELSRSSESLSRQVLQIAEWLQRFRSPRLSHIYDIVFDYFYWLGASRALAGLGITERSPDRVLQRLVGSAQGS